MPRPGSTRSSTRGGNDENGVRRMRVIVGIDRSEGSRAALRLGLREAAKHHAELVLVHAYQPAFEYAHATETTEILRAAALREAGELLEDELAQARAERRWAANRVTLRPGQGEPAEVLLAAAREDDLLVVGTNRGGLVRRLLLGSVSSKVVRFARGPVVVVPPRTPRRRRADCPPPSRARRRALGASTAHRSSSAAGRRSS